MKMPEWYVRLGVFGDLYYEYYAKVRALLESKTDHELRQLIEDAGQVTRINCGWGSFAVAPVVRDEAASILRGRAKE